MKQKEGGFLAILLHTLGASLLGNLLFIRGFNKWIRLLLCVIDTYRKYAWVIPLRDKRGIRTTNAFQKPLKESNRKPKKILVHKGSDFYTSSIKSWLEKNDIEMYSAHSEGRSVVAGRFIRT